MDLSKIAKYHPRVNQVDLLSGKQFREPGVSYQCHLKDGKNTCPDYVVESAVSKVGDNATKVEMSHFYSSSNVIVWLLNLFLKRELARETQDTLNAMKRCIEANIGH